MIPVSSYVYNGPRWFPQMERAVRENIPHSNVLFEMLSILYLNCETSYNWSITVSDIFIASARYGTSADYMTVQVRYYPRSTDTINVTITRASVDYSRQFTFAAENGYSYFDGMMPVIREYQRAKDALDISHGKAVS